MDEAVTMVLAAHPGEGFAEPRWVQPWGRTTLLGHVLDQLRAWPATPGIVLLGAHGEEVLDRVDLAGFSVLIDPEWEEGEAASIRAGLDFLAREPDTSTVVLVDGDDPRPSGEVVAGLLAAHVGSRRPATVPKYRYTRGRPLVIDRILWPRLLGMEAGSGVGALLDTHAGWVEEVWFDHLPPRRVVTPLDLRDLAPRR